MTEREEQFWREQVFKQIDSRFSRMDERMDRFQEDIGGKIDKMATSVANHQEHTAIQFGKVKGDILFHKGKLAGYALIISAVVSGVFKLALDWIEKART